MTKLNKKGTDGRLDREVRLAGGFGLLAARQDNEALLRRSVMACLLWEDNAYESGESVAEQIKRLIPITDPRVVADIAIEARQKQKLRHVPLFIAVEMTKYPEHKKLAREVIAQIITRVDQLVDLLAIHWKEGRKPLPLQMKRGLADAFAKFDEYQFAKYDRDGAIKLRDVLRVCHAKAPEGKNDLYKKINERTLTTPDTWEVALSKGADKKETWTRLIEERKIGGLAFLRNLRNMVDAAVPSNVVKCGFDNLRDKGLLPLNFFAARANAPRYEDEIEKAMLRVYGQLDKLPGLTVFVMDVSGSMGARYSAKSQFTRISAGAAMAVLAREQCENAVVFATAGSDAERKHQTAMLGNARGFALLEKIDKAAETLGGGGIFTRQCLEYIRAHMRGEEIDRVIVFSDSQDCDLVNKIPTMIGRTNYIIDVSSNTRGINYKGLWTAEISGWSEHFLTFIAAVEGLGVAEQEET